MTDDRTYTITELSQLMLEYITEVDPEAVEGLQWFLDSLPQDHKYTVGELREILTLWNVADTLLEGGEDEPS